MPARPDAVHVLDVDPDLVCDLDPDAARVARDQLVARVESLGPGTRRGAWGPPDPSGHLALMVVEGLMLRQLTLQRSRFAELFGPPDLLRPWDDGASLPAGASVHWEVVSGCTLAVLDRGFLRRASAWPEVVSALASRGISRAHTLAVQHAIGKLTRVDERVLGLFTHLAQRWGRVSTEGVVLDIPLTHDLVARLAGAQRPSVTTAIGQLTERGLVRRRQDRTWLLPHSTLGAGPGEQAETAGVA